jgi:hypothetical protein
VVVTGEVDVVVPVVVWLELVVVVTVVEGLLEVEELLLL